MVEVYDAREEIARLAAPRPNEAEEIRAFLQSKRRLLCWLPTLTDEERAQALVDFDKRFGSDLNPSE